MRAFRQRLSPTRSNGIAPHLLILMTPARVTRTEPEGVPARVTRTEPEGVPTRFILYVAIGFLVFVAGCLAGLFLYYSSFAGTRTRPKPEPFPAPQLQRTPLSDLENLKRQQRAQLTGYAWVDKDQGIIRIPIERAMQIVAARGGAAAFGSLDDFNNAPPPPKEKNKAAEAGQQNTPPNGAQR